MPKPTYTKQNIAPEGTKRACRKSRSLHTDMASVEEIASATGPKRNGAPNIAQTE